MGLAVGCSVSGVLPFNLGQNKNIQCGADLCEGQALKEAVSFGVTPPSGLTGCER